MFDNDGKQGGRIYQTMANKSERSKKNAKDEAGVSFIGKEEKTGGEEEEEGTLGCEGGEEK